MISSTFDFDKFVAAVKDLEYQEIQTATQAEIEAIDAKTGGHVKGAPAARKAGAPEYANLLRGLRCILTEGIRPNSVRDWDLPRMRPIIESLVRRGKMRPEALSIF